MEGKREEGRGREGKKQIVMRVREVTEIFETSKQYFYSDTLSKQLDHVAKTYETLILKKNKSKMKANNYVS